MVNITVVGTGYVGLSLSVLLAQHNKVTALEIDEEKVELINKKISPISDDEIEYFLKEKNLNLTATSDKKRAYINAEFVVIATPTDYDPETNYFNTSSVENVIKDILAANSQITIIIKQLIYRNYHNGAWNSSLSCCCWEWSSRTMRTSLRKKRIYRSNQSQALIL